MCAVGCPHLRCDADDGDRVGRSYVAALRPRSRCTARLRPATSARHGLDPCQLRCLGPLALTCRPCTGSIGIGGVLIAVGAAAHAGAPLAAGVVVFTGAIALWARANRNWWITCVLDLAKAVIVVEPTHSEFDRAAREIFVRSIR
jgi:hypothetical protein